MIATVPFNFCLPLWYFEVQFTDNHHHTRKTRESTLDKRWEWNPPSITNKHTTEQTKHAIDWFSKSKYVSVSHNPMFSFRAYYSYSCKTKNIIISFKWMYTHSTSPTILVYWNCSCSLICFLGIQNRNSFPYSQNCAYQMIYFIAAVVLFVQLYHAKYITVGKVSYWAHCKNWHY